MFRHAVSDEPIALSPLILSAPDFTEFVGHLLTSNFFFTNLTMISLASTPRSFSDPWVSSLIIFSILAYHRAIVLIFYGYQWFRSAPVSQSLLYKCGIKSLLFQSLFDLIYVFVLLICSLVPFQSMFLSENMLFSSYLLVSLFNVFIN